MLRGDALESRLRRTRVEILPRVHATHTCTNELIGTSAPMRELLARSSALAASDVTVLIEGETGIGKELVAEAIHARSPRSRAPVRRVRPRRRRANPAQLDAELFGRAAAPSERERQGAFSLAASGTLFLDEIGELTPRRSRCCCARSSASRSSRSAPSCTRPSTCASSHRPSTTCSRTSAPAASATTCTIG